MARRQHGLIRSLENEDLVTNPVTVEVVDPAETLEASLLEVNAEQVETDIKEEELEEAVEVVEALEAYRVVLATAGASGGLDRHGAATLQIGLESLYARVGIDFSSKSMPSMESFGGAAGPRTRATQLALEDISDKIKKVWASILEGLQRFWNWIKETYNKIFGSAERLKKRAEALISKGEATTGAVKGEAIKDAGLVKKLAIGTTVPNNISESIKAIASLVNSDSREGINKVVEEAMPKIMSDESITLESDVGVNTAGMVVTAGTGMKSATDAQATEGFQAFETDPILGNRKFVIISSKEVPKKVGEFLKVVRVSAAKLVTIEGIKTGETLPVLKIKEVDSIAKASIDVADAIIAGRKVADGVDKALKDFLASVKTASQNTKDNPERAKVIAAVQSSTLSAAKLFDGARSSLSGYALNTAQAAMAYAEASLKQYK